MFLPFVCFSDGNQLPRGCLIFVLDKSMDVGNLRFHNFVDKELHINYDYPIKWFV